jgi:hypothetical protein
VGIVILFREDHDTKEEAIIAASYFAVEGNRVKVPLNSFVVGRYSVLPFYKELDRDLIDRQSRLVNSYSEHCWIADLQQWYPYFEDLTPKTWFSLQEAMADDGPFVLKGATNSKKFEWDTHMYAADKSKLAGVYSRLNDDSLVGSQAICIRKYVPLKNFGTAIRGLPITNEHRTFFLDGKVMASGYYWSSHTDLIPAEFDKPPKEFLEEIGSRLRARFVVADVAQTESGDWILIELNDGQMSGLSEVDPHELYSNLAKALDSKGNHVPG